MAKAKPKAKGPAHRNAGSTRASRQRERESRALRNRLIGGGLLLVVAGVVLYAALRPGDGVVPADGRPVPEQLVSGAGGCTFDERFDGTAANQRAHIPNPTYALDPPSGGPHLPVPADPGFYQPGRAPADGAVVHAQEHGFVILWYRPDLSASKQQELADLSDQFGRELILVPRPSLPGEVAVTAWHRRLLCDTLVPDKVGIFTRAFVNQAPEKGFL